MLQNALRAAKRLARSRLLEQERPDPLINDPFVHPLLTEIEKTATDGVGESSLEVTLDALSTRYIDDCLMQATSLVNEEHGDYRQVVLVSPGLDTRAFRLPWPKNIVIYDVAPQEVHSLIKEKLRLRPPTGCLRVPISFNFKNTQLLSSRLERVGFRGDRLSVWAIQGLQAMDLRQEELQSLFVEISQLSKCKSLLFGELPGSTKSKVAEFLFDFAFFGVVTDFTDEDISFGRLLKTEDTLGRFLFSFQQQGLSAKEQEIYSAHVQAAEETDEDFFENIS
eukprot:g85.t1